MSYVEELDNCKNFGDILDVVRKTVKKSLGQGRVGLMLYLADLPPNIGAFHPVGTNVIVVNDTLLKATARSVDSTRQLNSFVYSILLHEYLHSIGYLDEKEVGRLVQKVSAETLGNDHPATRMATEGPRSLLSEPIPIEGQVQQDPLGFQLVKDFDRSNQAYIG